jgi:hypothetical protein
VLGKVEIADADKRAGIVAALTGLSAAESSTREEYYRKEKLLVPRD